MVARLGNLNSPSNLLSTDERWAWARSRNVTGTWSLGTITSPEKIRSMQAVYLRAIRGRAAGDPAFGWLKVGGQSDVPKQASYVGQFQDVYVWVMPDGMEGLSDLTLAIMDIATRDDTGGGPVRGRWARAWPCRVSGCIAAELSGSTDRAGVHAGQAVKTRPRSLTSLVARHRLAIDLPGLPWAFRRESARVREPVLRGLAFWGALT